MRTLDYIPSARQRRIRDAATTLGWLCVLAIAAFLLFVLARATAHAQVCPPPGCTLTCQQDDGFGSYEVKKQRQGTLVAVVSTRFTGNAKVGDLKRLLVPDLPGTQHYGAFQVLDNTIPPQNGASFTALTSLGLWSMRLRGAKWVVLEADKQHTCPAVPAVLGGQGFVCYNTDTVRDATTGATIGRFHLSWTDQFKAQAGDFGTPITACFPFMGTPGNGFLMLGRAENVGRAPAGVCVDTPLTDPVVLDLDPLDERAVAIQ